MTNSVPLQEKIIAHRENPGYPQPVATSSNNVVEENATYTSTLFSKETSDSQKILGVSWNPVSDTLIFDIRTIANSLRTLRGM